MIGAILWALVQVPPPVVVEAASEPIFRVPTAGEAKDMLKAVPGIAKDAGAALGKTVTRSMLAVDLAILAEEIGLELFDAQADRQRVRLLVLDERATRWRQRIDSGPPLSGEEKRLLREEMRLMAKDFETTRTRFVTRAFTQPGAIKIAAVGAARYYGLKALRARLGGLGKRVKEVIFGGRFPPYVVRRLGQKAWKALEKRQLEADKAIDALIKHTVGRVALKEAADHGKKVWDQALREDAAREERNRASAAYTAARWNLAMRLELPKAVAAAPLPAVAVPARIVAPIDPVLRAASVDYQVSPSRATYHSGDDDRPQTTPAYREERFYPEPERRGMGGGEAVNQLKRVSIRGWGGN